jgi:hypothetical protein
MMKQRSCLFELEPDSVPEPDSGLDLWLDSWESERLAVGFAGLEAASRVDQLLR